MKWFSEHRLFTVISGIVIVLCVIMIASWATSGGSFAAGKGIQTVMSGIQRPLNAAQAAIRENIGGLFTVHKTQQENKKLRSRVEALEKENQELQLKKDEVRQLKQLSKSFDYKPFQRAGKAKAAHVIEIDSSNPYIVFTIDIGTERQIRKNDIVVDGSGLVGKIQETGYGYSKVVSVLSNKNSISFKVLRKTSITGVLKGDGNGKLSGYLMDDQASVLKGDILVTSGIGVYPEGIRIGTVSSVDYDEDSQLKMVHVTPTVRFSGLQKVAVYYEY